MCVSSEAGCDGGRLSLSGVGVGGSVRITHKTGSSSVMGIGSGFGGGGSSSGLSIDDGATRFPRLDQCAHFHYEYVELPPITVSTLSVLWHPSLNELTPYMISSG